METKYRDTSMGGQLGPWLTAHPMVETNSEIPLLICEFWTLNLLSFTYMAPFKLFNVQSAPLYYIHGSVPEYRTTKHTLICRRIDLLPKGAFGSCWLLHGIYDLLGAGPHLLART